MRRIEREILRHGERRRGRDQTDTKTEREEDTG
jgi:hypothetical protein